MNASWIAGLMRENYEAVGFIPEPTIMHRYMRLGRFVLQTNERGNPCGYLLHGAIQCGRSLSITQHCIQYESRLHGYGESAIATIVLRAERAGVSAITLRCATDLDALMFWQSQGFAIRNIAPGGKQRQREIACMVRLLMLPLLSEL